MNIVFMGTPDFAVPCLDILIKNHHVMAVFTQPDRPKGRGKKLAMSAVKERALKDDIKVYQPEKIRKDLEHIELLKQLKPDVIVVVAYGQILSQELLDIPKQGCINVHASLLPKLRGAAPINWSIVNGDLETGVTTMYMARGIDTGDMIQKSKMIITENMTAGELNAQLKEMGSELIINTLKAIEEGSMTRTVQDHENSSHAPLMDKSLSVVDWSKTCQEVHNLIRGFNPWPVATTSISGQKVKLFTSRTSKEASVGIPGSIVEATKEGIWVNCSDFQIRLTEIQMPNKKRMTVEAYLLGNSIDEGTQLGG